MDLYVHVYIYTMYMHSIVIAGLNAAALTLCSALKAHYSGCIGGRARVGGLLGVHISPGTRQVG